MDPLSLLKNLLHVSAENTPISIPRSSDIDDVLEQLQQQARNGYSNHVPRDLQIEAVKLFWDSGEFMSFREARLVCFGIAVRPWNDHRCLIEEPARFNAVLTGLRHWEENPRQFRKCYQGLMHGYFHYYGGYQLDMDGRPLPMVGQRNWLELRRYLAEKTSYIQADSINPDWVVCVQGNKGLFTESPCDAYAEDVLNGQQDKVRQIRDHLGISDASWFTRSLVLSQIEKVCKQRDMLFLSKVDQLLALLGDNKVLRNLGLQMILDRYAQVQDRPLHPKLKDISVTAWGIPWSENHQSSPEDHQWDRVAFEGPQWSGVTLAAREMVDNWLKEECIELFFTKLVREAQDSSQGGNNKSLRRLAFWKSFIPQIKKIRFALGPHARDPRQRDFVELRKRIKGLDVDLQDTNRYNNALIMTFGDLVAVEFSGESNAFYGYSLKRTLPFDLNTSVRTAPVNGRNSLKNDVCVLRLGHQDNILGHARWEDRFKEELKDSFGLMVTTRTTQATRTQSPQIPGSSAATTSNLVALRPGVSTPHKATHPVNQIEPSTSQRAQDFRVRVTNQARPVTSPLTSGSSGHAPSTPPATLTQAEDLSDLQVLAKRFNAAVVDHRAKGGALWVVMGDHPKARRTLANWGFTFVKGKGWWKKDQE